MFAYVVVDFPIQSAVLSVGRAMLGTPEILAILAVVVLLFGAAKLPQLGKGLGEAIGNFKKAKKDGEEAALRTEVDATPKVEVEHKDKLGRDPHA